MKGKGGKRLKSMIFYFNECKKDAQSRPSRDDLLKLRHPDKEVPT